MKDQFRKHSQRLSDEEKETIWRSIPKAPDVEKKRRLQFWAGLATSTTAVALLIVMGLVYINTPDRMTGFDEIAFAPETLEVRMNKATGEISLGGETVNGVEVHELKAPGTRAARSIAFGEGIAEKAAPPAESESVPTVASSDEAPRGPAAFKQEPDESALLARTAESDVIEDVAFEETGAPVDSDKEEPKPAAASRRRDAGRERPVNPLRMGRVTGSVVDADTGDPLAFANVIAEDTNFGAMTMEDGSFQFELPCGHYNIRVTYLGYESARKEKVRICDDARPNLKFSLKPSVTLELDAVEVWGEAPAVDVKSSTVTKSKDSEKRHSFDIDRLEEPEERVEAMALESGITMKNGELFVRGGRSGEVLMQIDGVPVNDPLGGGPAGAPDQAHALNPGKKRESEREELYRRRSARPRRRCWIPPGWNPPNGEAYDTVFFEHYGVNPFIPTDEDALSTFAVDVDEASYTITRRYLDDGFLPPADAIRVEEFVNYFEQGYETPDDEDFAIILDAAPSPFGEGYYLLRVGIKGREVKDSQRKPANLVFVVDTSGSMKRENRLGLVKRALLLLLDELEPSDTVGIVEYGSVGRVVLEPTHVEERRRIERAIENLRTDGSTNAEEGLALGYEMASRRLERDAINRLILCSDGVANTGATQAERILDRVRYESDRGIYLSTVGFGMGNYNDVLMEKLADQGDGNYHYVDVIEEAERVFVENLTGTLQTIARDAKIQVEFDRNSIVRWRLLGYENRDVADEDFRNDKVDAGEIGAGHEVTALYEIKVAPGMAELLQPGVHFRGRPTLGKVRLRYETPETEGRKAGDIVELEERFEYGDFRFDFDETDPRFKLSALTAEFAEILRKSFWAKGSELGDLLSEVRRVERELGDDETFEEFHDLVRAAARIAERER